MTSIRTFTAALFLLAAATSFAQIDDSPDQPDEHAPAPEGVEPVIPLDKNDPTYDLWKAVRDDLSEGRERACRHPAA